MRARIRAFLALPAPDRRLFVHAFFLLPVTALSVRRLGLNRTAGWLGRRAPAAAGPSGHQVEERARRTAAVVGRAARYTPWSGRCLSRSYTLWYLLRRQGIAADVHIGVRTDRAGPRPPLEDLAAHAWVEYRGQVLNDHPGVREEFAPFPTPVT